MKLSRLNFGREGEGRSGHASLPLGFLDKTDFWKVVWDREEKSRGRGLYARPTPTPKARTMHVALGAFGRARAHGTCESRV
jgi:hypothetical protein